MARTMALQPKTSTRLGRCGVVLAMPLPCSIGGAGRVPWNCPIMDSSAISSTAVWIEPWAEASTVSSVDANSSLAGTTTAESRSFRITSNPGTSTGDIRR